MATVFPSASDSHFVEVDGAKMHYIEQGRGDPILFLHGMPTSSYLWRNVIPYLSPLGRCIAVDLIGMGKSDKPNISYSIQDHIKYIEKFIQKLNLENVVLVMHGMGSVIGLDYATKNPGNVKGLVLYESYFRPFIEDEMPLTFQEQIAILDQEETQDLILNSTYFVDKVLPQSMMRPLTEEEMTHYREPFLHKGSGKPIMQYLREMPRGDGQSQIDKTILNYSEKLGKSTTPKLMLFSVPGFVTTIGSVMWARENLPNLEVIDIGEELHFAQESHPALMGETISAWIQGIEQTT